MKKFTKLLGIVLIIALVMSMGAGALADNTAIETPANGFTVTITPNATDEGVHSYEAYQIFKGDLAEDENHNKILSNIEWGTGITVDEAFVAAIEALRDNTAEDYQALTVDSSAAEFAAAIGDLNAAHDDATAQAVAAAIGAALSSTTSGTGSATGVSGLQPGYYLIQDAIAPTAPDAYHNSGAKTRYILEVVGTVSVAEKGSVPSVEKKVDDVNDSDAGGSEDAINWRDSADYDIGDSVPYKLTGTMPSTFADYDWYYYEFTDTMCTGLTYNNDAKIYVSIPTYDEDGNVTGKTWYDMTTEFTSLWANQVLTIKDDISVAADGTVNDAGLRSPKSGKLVTGYEDTMTQAELNKATAETATTGLLLTKDSEVVVRYSATLNENAEIGAIGNENKVKLIYSNNPNKGGSGEKGNTPEDINIVFTYDIEVNKVEPEKGEKSVYKPLAGAAFTLYKLYTDANIGDKTPVTEIKYSNGTKTYTIGDNEKWVLVEQKTAGANTAFTFEGVDDGIYLLVETTTPAGFNSILPSKFAVNADHYDYQTPPYLSNVYGTDLKGNDNNLAAIKLGLKTNPDTGEITGLKTNVVNQSGTVLPSTGGIGTTIFYVVGSILVVAAGVLLITKKRMSREG